VIAVHSQDIAKIRSILSERPGILAIEPFGSTVHVRFDPKAWKVPALEALIAANNQDKPVIEPADVSLEDVFLAAVASGGATAPKGSEAREASVATEPSGGQS
jgi:hypothetical protein